MVRLSSKMGTIEQPEVGQMSKVNIFSNDNIWHVGCHSIGNFVRIRDMLFIYFYHEPLLRYYGFNVFKTSFVFRMDLIRE